MRRLAPALALAAIAAAGLVWWLMRDPTPARLPSPHTGADLPALDRGVESASAESKPVDRKITPLASTDSRSTELTSKSAIAAAVISGRCVDAASKAPLAGCRAELRGAVSTPERGDAWIRRNGPLEWKDPVPVVTGDDGRFEVSFAPPPPYQFFLSLDGPGRAAMDGRWNEIAPEAVVELGDIPMAPGTLVKGRIVDEGGAPCPNVSFSLGAAAARRAPMGKVAARQNFIARTQADGRFTFERPFLAGTYAIEVRDAGDVVLPESKSLELEEGQPERFLELKLRLPSDADAILGLVHDDAGNPVPNAEIDIVPSNSDSPGMSRIVMSGQDGAFRIQRANPNYQGTPALTAKKTGYEKPEPTKCEWGTKGVVLVLRRGLTVQVVVMDGDENKPLERYGVRCFSMYRSERRWGSRTKGAMVAHGGEDPNGAQLRLRGIHPEGVLELKGVTRGRQVLLVEPDGSDWAPSRFREFEMTDSGAPRQEITVWRNVKKTVRVKRRDGTPVAKTEVDVVRAASDRVVDERTQEFPVDRIIGMSNWGALRLDDGETSADGTVELAAPPHERLFVRALGPGHLSAVREVDFATAGPVIDIVVTAGASLTGQILPREILVQLNPELGLPEGERKKGRFSGALLRRDGPERIEFPSGFSAAPIAEDGTFRLDGIPPGAWDVRLRYSEPAGAGASTMGMHVIGRVELADGDDRKETFDLASLLKGDLEGTISVDGKPLEKGTVTFEGTRESSAEDDRSIMRQNVAVTEGKFQAALWPAQYRAFIQFQKDGRYCAMHDADVFRLAAGAQVVKSFHFRSSVLKLRLLASDGLTPLAGLDALQIEVPDSIWTIGVNAADPQGNTEVEGLPALTVTVKAWPKRLSSAESRRTHYRQGSSERSDDPLVQVATVAITPPLTTATIVLPASLGY